MCNTNISRMLGIQTTIFGSSRQASIKENFRTTTIRAEIGDTPSTKEIIQAIECCKGIIKPDTKRCFQSGILRNKEINTSVVQEAFQRTDLFVVEIASRNVYEWNGMYVHKSLTEEKYGVTNIQMRSLSDDEIEEDLQKIKELLEPKKILIVSHIHIRDTGERVELIELLERLCLKYDLPFLSPSDYLHAEKDVYKKEAVLANFTKHGYDLMGRVYKRVIEDLFKTKTIVFVLKQQYVNVSKGNSFWGLGDILRNVFFMYKLSFVSDFKVIIDLFNHPLCEYIKCSEHKYRKQVQENLDNVLFHRDDNTIYSIIENGFKTSDVLYMGVYHGLETYMPTDYDTDINLFVKKNFQPNVELNQYIQSKIVGLDLSSMNIIHYRLGDKELVDGNVDAKKLYLCYLHLLSVLKEKSILLSDSNTFKMLVESNRNPNIQMFNHAIGHIGHDTDSEGIKNSLFEFFIATRAKSIQTYTVYGWVSGYMRSINKIYGVPMIDAQRNLEHMLNHFHQMEPPM